MSPSSQSFSPSFLVASVIFTIFTVSGIVSAAWVDAPNAPPNYGITGCTYPCEEEDFRPMNLGATPQTKRAGATFEGNITADGFLDRQNTAYLIDPESSAVAGNFKGSVGIGSGPLSVGISTPLFSGAKIIANNPEIPGKTGSLGDGVYVFASSTNAAIAAEQGNPAGYGVYSSGGINYFEGNVGIGTQTPAGILHAGTKNYKMTQSGIFGHSAPRCSCDMNNDIPECPTSSVTTDPAGTTCYDQYRENILFIPTNFSRRFQVIAGGLVVKETGDIEITGNVTLSLPTSSHAGCVLVSSNETGVLEWRNIIGGACQADASFLSKCLAEGGQSVDGSGNCTYTYTDPVATFGWGREIRNGDSQYICANMGGHPTWTYLSHTTTTHGTSCGSLYGLVYWDGSSFVNWGQFGGICGGNVTVDTTVTCKVPVAITSGIYTKYCSGNGCTVSCDPGDPRTGCSCWTSGSDWNNEQAENCTPVNPNGCSVNASSGSSEKRAYAYCLNL